MERTITINKQVYDQPLDAPKSKRMKIELYLPPSDIPQLIKPEYKEKEDVLIIEFKYLDLEKERTLFERENVKLIIGFYSGKPLRIEIRAIREENINQIKLVNKISNDVNRLIQENVEKIQNIREKTSLKLAGEIIHQNARKLADQVL